MTNSLPSADIPAADPVADEDHDELLIARLELSARGISLERADGRVFLRFNGEVDVDCLCVPYDLVPAQGVLAKASKWRKMAPEVREVLLRERASEEAASELHGHVSDFAREMADACEDDGLAPMDFLHALADMRVAEPAGAVFDRIRQRLEHAGERQREERHAERTRQSISLGDYPASFEVASKLPRKFIALLGPTNSGKTHRAIEALAAAPSGVYLAPLRLLALENFERLQAMSPHGRPLAVSLVTGEERRLAPGATHVASTVEMLDTRTPVDVAVIDEIQMLSDRDRGAAWTAAVCGAPARTVYLVGAPEARRAIEALAERLECPLEVHLLKRKGPLNMDVAPVGKLRNLRKGDAVIAFSRREVLKWRDLATEAGLSVATVYGNLSPEVRRAQAQRFRDGAADVVVGTDALAMGLNMPIARIVMTTTIKYNGVEEEEISAALARQIAGRAGRFGVHEEGLVAGFDGETHAVMRSLLKEKPVPLGATGFAVAPTLEHLHRIASVTGENSLARLLKRFVHNIDVPDGFFFPRITEDQFERAAWLDTLELSVAEKFALSLVPVSSKVASLQHAWENWAIALAKKKVVRLPTDRYGMGFMQLQEVEDACRLYSAYAWLAYRLPETYPDTAQAQELSRLASERVDAMLQDQNAAARRRQPKKFRR
jgi:ATP-dependent RNA helicase SUPV3L1/SUV3